MGFDSGQTLIYERSNGVTYASFDPPQIVFQDG